ncbi:MAG: GNAT family N-acetyltransferase [Sulfuritalea sp.]|nr:GNAT family N-acetyltransferase [Sulfuritalea sp.]
MSNRSANPAKKLARARSTFITTGTPWQDVAAAFAARNLWDVYFDSAYLGLYAGGSEAREVEAYCYEADGDRFFLPYLKAPIPGFPGLWDFQSAYGYGGPLATTDEAGFLGAAWTAFMQEAGDRGGVCGLLRFHPLLNTERFAASPVSLISDRDTVWLDLQRPAEEVYSEYSKENRRKLRKASREGVAVEAGSGSDVLSAFCELYSGRMSELGARSEYFFGRGYFNAIAGLGPEAYRVYLCRNAPGEVIGGALILLSPQFVHYHLSASREDCFHMAPNNVLRDGVIRDFVGGTRSAIHFGGGLTGDPKDSLWRSS